MLKKILKFLGKNKLFLLLLFIASTFFIIPQTANADLIGALDAIDSSLNALDFIDTVSAKIVEIITIAAGSVVFMQFSAAILDWALSLDLNVYSNALVSTGWSFVTGISNMVIILFFVYNAISMIISGNSEDGKKNLIKLVIIAVLINFSLLFVSMAVDVVNAIQQALVTQFNGTEGFVGMTEQVQSQLNMYTKNFIVGNLASWVIARTFALVVPVANLAVLVGTIILYLGITINGVLPVAVLAIALNFIMGIMFLSVAIILLVRIIMIWLLAILAPLAIAFSGNKETNKFFKEWLSSLTEWLFAGIMIIFFIGLGFKLFTTPLLDWGTLTNVNVLGIVIPSFFLNYIFLAVYMFVVLIQTKKWTPGMINEIVGTATSTANKIQRNARRISSPINRADKAAGKAGANYLSKGAEKYEEGRDAKVKAYEESRIPERNLKFGNDLKTYDEETKEGKEKAFKEYKGGIYGGRWRHNLANKITTSSGRAFPNNEKREDSIKEIMNSTNAKNASVDQMEAILSSRNVPKILGKKLGVSTIKMEALLTANPKTFGKAFSSLSKELQENMSKKAAGMSDSSKKEFHKVILGSKSKDKNALFANANLKLDKDALHGVEGVGEGNLYLSQAIYNAAADNDLAAKVTAEDIKDKGVQEVIYGNWSPLALREACKEKSFKDQMIKNIADLKADPDKLDRIEKGNKRLYKEIENQGILNPKAAVVTANNSSSNNIGAGRNTGAPSNRPESQMKRDARNKKRGFGENQNPKTK